MAIDLKALDRKIKKLQRLRDLAAECQNDPEFAAMLTEFVTPNGKIQVAPKPASIADSKPNGSERKRGYFIGAVTQAITSLTGDFTSLDIEKMLRDRGVRIAANNANVAINDVLNTLEKRGLIERNGKRGVAVLWKRKNSAVESRTA